MALVSDAMVSGESNSTMVTPRTCPSAGAVLGASFEQPPLAKTRLSLHFVVRYHELGVKAHFPGSRAAL